MKAAIVLPALLLAAASCKTSGPSLFGKRSLHEQYGQSLKNAGLEKTAIGNSWFQAAAQALSNPVNIKLPYKEFTYLDASQPRALGLQFTAKRGEKIVVEVERKPLAGSRVFVELWDTNGGEQEFLQEADTSNRLDLDAETDGLLILRLQPELLAGGEYTITIRNGPSLVFPVKTERQVISSFWGADRDGGARKHEGVDIFAPRGTPLIAAAEGRITRVDETEIGGKTVWLRPKGKDYVLYYAHLQEQLVKAGQQVKQSEVIGTTGNSGNARTTGPHLHFGIYAAGGAIDPLWFIQPNRNSLPNFSADISGINKVKLTGPAAALYTAPGASAAAFQLPRNTPLRQIGFTGAWSRVVTPDGQTGFVKSEKLETPGQKQITAANDHTVYDKPSTGAARKMIIRKGERFQLIGNFSNLSYIACHGIDGWVQL